MWRVLLLLLCLGPVTPNQETGNCSQPQPLCCFGLNHHCKRGSCYCDEFCHAVPDCCPDYSALCSPASHTPKMVLQMVLQMENTPSHSRINQDWVQSMQLLQTGLSGTSLSITVKGIRKKA